MGAEGMAPVKTWNWTVEWREGVSEPIAAGLFASSVVHLPLQYDETTFAALKSYVHDSAENDRKFVALIDSLRASQEPILVWGAGTLARRLLATSSLAATNIVAFVDSNPALEGTLLAGKHVLAPNGLLAQKEAILICSIPFKAEILATIRAMQLPNRILSFSQ